MNDSFGKASPLIIFPLSPSFLLLLSQVHGPSLHCIPSAGHPPLPKIHVLSETKSYHHCSLKNPSGCTLELFTEVVTHCGPNTKTEQLNLYNHMRFINSQAHGGHPKGSSEVVKRCTRSWTIVECYRLYTSLNVHIWNRQVSGGTLTLDRVLPAPLFLTLFSQMPESFLEDEMLFKCPKGGWIDLPAGLNCDSCPRFDPALVFEGRTSSNRQLARQLIHRWS